MNKPMFAETVTEADEELAEKLVDAWEGGRLLAELASMIGGYREQWSGLLNRDGSKEQP